MSRKQIFRFTYSLPYVVFKVQRTVPSGPAPVFTDHGHQGAGADLGSLMLILCKEEIIPGTRLLFHIVSNIVPSAA